MAGARLALVVANEDYADDGPIDGRVVGLGEPLPETATT